MPTLRNPHALVVLPARGGSKRIPKKNMAPLLGRPLLHYALTSALQAHLPARVVVSSDDKAILEFASGYGENIALPRPADLAADLTPSQPVLQHALEVCEAQDGIRYESIVLVQPTNPLVSPQDIDATIDKLQDTGCDSCFTVVRLDHLYPEKLKQLEGDKLIDAFGAETEMRRSQAVRDLYMRNGACYGVARDVLLSGSLFGNDIRAIPVPKVRSVDINDEEDLLIAAALLSELEKRQ